MPVPLQDSLTGDASFVESGFWNFDSLFVPQQHPARDLQDTFYVSDPAEADMPRADPELEATMDQMEAGLDRINGTTGSKEVRLRTPSFPHHHR